MCATCRNIQLFLLEMPKPEYGQQLPFLISAEYYRGKTEPEWISSEEIILLASRFFAIRMRFPHPSIDKKRLQGVTE